MLSDSGYCRFLKINLKKLDHDGRYESLNSWYHPKYDRVEEDITMLHGLFQTNKIEHPSQVDQHFISQLFTSAVHLDTFSRFLDKKMDKKMYIMERGVQQDITTFREVVQIGLSLSHPCFIYVLGLLETSNSVLIHAKIAEFMIEYMKNKRIEANLSMVIKEQDLTTLYRIAKTVSFYDEVPTTVFKYTIEMQQLIRELISPALHEKLLTNIMKLYYLDCIAVSIGALENEKNFGLVYPMLIESIESFIAKIVNYLQDGECTFLSHELWFCLKHRNADLSQLGQFILAFLFSVSDCSDDVTRLLMLNDTDLVNHIRDLATSRFNHVRQSVSLLMPNFEKEKWKSLLTLTYSNADYVVEDLVISAQRTMLDSTPPLISAIALNFTSDLLDVEKQQRLKEEQEYTGEEQADLIATMQLVNGLLDMRVFLKLLNEITTANHQKRMHQGTAMAAMFLAKFAKFLACNDLLKAHIARTGRSMPSVSWKNMRNVLKKNATSKKKSGGGGNTGSRYSATSSSAPPSSSQLSQLSSSDSPVMSPISSPMSASVFEQSTSFPRTSSSFSLEGSSKLEITSEYVMQILDFVSSDNTKQRKSYKPRIYMLECLRHLLKNQDIFENLVCKRNDTVAQTQFYSRLLELCKDGSDMLFNRNAWCLFYQLIKFHSGVIEQLVKLNMLGSFLELIDSSTLAPGQTSSSATNLHAVAAQQSSQLNTTAGGSSQLQVSVVTTNAFYYLDKIFNLPENTNPKENWLTIGGVRDKYDAFNSRDSDMKEEHLTRIGCNKPAEDVVKQYEKTVSRLSDFIVQKQIYAHWYTAYLRLKEGYSGWPFHCMVKFFATLHNHSSCTRLLTTFKRNREHREALNDIARCISGLTGVSTTVMM